MKTKEELIELKTEYETMNEKLAELSEDELEQVTGGQYVNHDYPSLKALDSFNRKAKSKSSLIEQISTGIIPKESISFRAVENRELIEAEICSESDSFLLNRIAET